MSSPSRFAARRAKSTKLSAHLQSRSVAHLLPTRHRPQRRRRRSKSISLRTTAMSISRIGRSLKLSSRLPTRQNSRSDVSRLCFRYLPANSPHMAPFRNIWTRHLVQSATPCEAIHLHRECHVTVFWQQTARSAASAGPGAPMASTAEKRSSCSRARACASIRRAKRSVPSLQPINEVRTLKC